MSGTYGQTDALAIAIAERITVCGTLSLPVTAQRRFRMLDPMTEIPAYDEPVSVFVAPGMERSDRAGISTAFESTYTVHIALQQQISGAADEEVQCERLMRLRSEILEDLRTRSFQLTDAVHPVTHAFVISVENASENGKVGLPYNLARLLNDHVFESDTILTLKASA